MQNIDKDSFREAFTGLSLILPGTVGSRRVGDDSVVVVNMSTGSYILLEGVGAFIWLGICDGLSPQVIRNEIEAEYEVSRQQASEDLNSFLESLLEQGFIGISRL